MTGTWSFYNTETGELVGRVFHGQEDHLAQNTPAGCGAVNGQVDHRSHRVDIKTGAVVDWQPPQPDDNHEWDSISRRWKLTASAAEIARRHDEAKSEIDTLERQQLRALREAALGDSEASTRLSQIDAQIAALRPQLSADPPRLKRSQ